MLQPQFITSEGGITVHTVATSNPEPAIEAALGHILAEAKEQIRAENQG